MEISHTELFRGCEITDLGANKVYTGVASDSRAVKKGELFICHRGLHRDGRDYAGDALEAGAAAILADGIIDGIPTEKMLLTPDTRRAESFIWRNITAHPLDGMRVVAVTGTAGKTSIVYLLRHILASAGEQVGMISTIKSTAGNEEISLGPRGGSSVCDIAGAMTTPDPEYFFGAAKQMKDAGCTTLVYEASSQSLLYNKLAAVHNDIAVFTNLSPEHLDCHGNMESYFEAKLSLMNISDRAVVNADDRWMARICERCPDHDIVRCSLDSARHADVYGVNYKSHGEGGIEYLLISDDAVFKLRSPMIGIPSAYNTLEAAATALMLGVDPTVIRDSLRDFGGAEGRMVKVGTGSRSLDEAGDITVFIDYAHTPESMRAMLSSATEISDNLTVLFGCGGDRDRTKRAECARIAQAYARRVIITSDNPRSEPPMRIIDDILEGIDKSKNYTVIPERRIAVEYAVLSAKRGETVILCGKGHEKYEIDADGKHPYDEYEAVADALRRRFSDNGETAGD